MFSLVRSLKLDPLTGIASAIFKVGGGSHASDPAGFVEQRAKASDEEWANYLFYRDNVRGVHRERWLHSFGCRQWFLVERDTVTHDILGSCRFDESRGAGAGPGSS